MRSLKSLPNTPDLKSARKIILTHLQSQKGATNFKLIELIGGDLPLFERIKEELIFNDLAEDKKGAGLVYIGSEKVNDDKNTGIQSEHNTFQISGSVSHKVFISYGRKDAERKWSVYQDNIDSNYPKICLKYFSRQIILGLTFAFLSRKNVPE